ncbi:MAG: hypothetical protein HQK97_02160 [Nitrospirae bacterium]|nr:hypothetical protein [Nitrospirota bacterium]
MIKSTCAYLKSNTLFIVAVAIAAALRAYQITYQIIADDEWHALHKVLNSTMLAIISNPGETTDSVPMTVFYKFMLEHVMLSEWVMLAPSLVFGMLTVVTLPAAAREIIGGRAATLLACLIAISPLLIFFSRLARPYAFIPVLTFGGVMAFLKWSGGRGKRWAVIYVICAVAAPYLHLTALPFLAAPLFILPVEKLWQRYSSNPAASTSRTSNYETIIVYTIVPVLSSLLVYLVLRDSSGSFAAKISKDRPTVETCIETLKLFYGVQHAWVVGVLIAASVVGLMQILKMHRRFALYVLSACIFQILFIAVSGPFASNAPAVFSRYVLSLLPVLLMFTAAAVVYFDSALRGIIRWWPHALGIFIVLTLLIFSPLKTIYYQPNSFTNHALFQHNYNPDNKYAAKLRPKSIPQFYYNLAKLERNSITIIEAPWYYPYQSNAIYVYYQQVHRQRVVIGFVGTDLIRFGEFPINGRARFRNFVHLSDNQADNQALKMRTIKYVVFHLNLFDEVTSRYSGAVAVDMTGWIAYYKSIYGIPVYMDDKIVVFDVS